MKVAVIGAGAIGSLTGAFLWERGHDVTLVGRPEQVSAINKSGVAVEGPDGEKTYMVPAKPCLDFNADAVILAVKTQDVEAATRAAAPAVSGAIVVTMQNGVKADEIAAGQLGPDRIVSSVVMFGATCLTPGRVVYNFPHSLLIGKAFDTGAGGESVEAARGMFEGAFDVRVSGDIHGAHRAKLILNLSNAIAGILGLSLQETFEDPDNCLLGVMMMREAREVMDASGLGLADLPGLPAEKLRALLSAPPDAAAGVYGGIMRGLSKGPLPGSILQSIRRGRPSEVDYLNGEVAVLGLLRRHPAPLNAKAVRLVKEVERTGRFIPKERLHKEMDA